MALFSKKTDTKKSTSESENVLPARQTGAGKAGGDLAKETPKTATVLKEDTGRAHRILKNYHLSEKSNAFATTGRYVFVVNRSANKIEVKKAVESVYGVHVTGVNIMNTQGKPRRSGRIAGRTQDWKKAIVTLKEGERISALAEGV